MQVILNVHFTKNQRVAILLRSSDKLYIRERIGVFLLIITAKITKNKWFLSMMRNKKCPKKDF